MKQLGRKHRHFFRIVAIDARQPRDGKVLEELGSYDPHVPDTNERVVLKPDATAVRSTPDATEVRLNPDAIASIVCAATSTSMTVSGLVSISVCSRSTSAGAAAKQGSPSIAALP